MSVLIVQNKWKKIMSNPNYVAGRNLEYEYKKQLEKEGFLTLRTAGSHGPFDLIGIRGNMPIQLVQCKRVSTVREANRIIEKFKANPPLPLMGDGTHYVQSIVVKVKGDRVLREAFAI